MLKNDKWMCGRACACPHLKSDLCMHPHKHFWKKFRTYLHKILCNRTCAGTWARTYTNSLKLECSLRNNFLPLCSTSLLLRNGKQARRYRSLPLAIGENACLPALEESIIKKDLIFAFGFSFLLLPMHSNKYYIHAYCTVKYLDQ